MRDELLAYLLDDLDAEQRSRIEERLAVDPIWQHELDRLRSYVEASEEAPADDALPQDLVNRTCSFVQQASAQGELSPAVLPASLTESQDIAAAGKRRWSLIDLAVAGGILLAVGSLLLPALRDSRDAARRLQCQNNLRTLGAALAAYADGNEGQLPTIEQQEYAGMFAVKMAEAGVLTREQLAELLVCPSSQLAEDIFQGRVVMLVPTRQQLAISSGADLQALVKHMGGSFAYRVGYLDRHNNYRNVKFVGSTQAPMMADRPCFELPGFQSDNHRGCGQNVLFQDQSVRYQALCLQQGRDKNWYLNEKNQPAAGVNKHDVVLIRSESRP